MFDKNFMATIDGLLLSDASIGKDHRFSITQCKAHEEWIIALIDYFENNGLTVSKTSSLRTKAMIKGKLCNRQATVGLRLRVSDFFKEQRRRWYTPDGIKIVPADVDLSAVSLAYWCCGDGYRGGRGYHLTFCTDSFSDADRNLLVSRLNEIYGWKLTRSQKRGRISITKNADRNGFRSLVEEHFPQSMRYKLNLKINTDRLKSKLERDQIKRAKRKLYDIRIKHERPLETNEECETRLLAQRTISRRHYQKQIATETELERCARLLKNKEYLKSYRLRAS